jgi:hypothetical protein
VALVRLAALFVVVMLVTALAAAPATSATVCVRVVGGNWNPPGNDNYPPALNAESVKIKNVCATSQGIAGWKLHDDGRKHTFTFPAGFRVGPGVTVTVCSGRGTRSATRLYWGRTYGAVWNDGPPERAYLRNAAGTLVSSWSKY